MNKILEICSMMLSITEALMHSKWQLMESHYLYSTGKSELADDLQDNISEQLRECLRKIGELSGICADAFPPDDEDFEDYDEEDEDEDNDEDADSDLQPALSPETCAEFSRMLDLTDAAISREHMSRLAANTGNPQRAALMRGQSEKLWHDAFLSMCKYVAMSHDDTIDNVMRKK